MTTSRLQMRRWRVEGVRHHFSVTNLSGLIQANQQISHHTHYPTFARANICPRTGKQMDMDAYNVDGIAA